MRAAWICPGKDGVGAVGDGVGLRQCQVWDVRTSLSVWPPEQRGCAGGAITQDRSIKQA